jgi:hypothetical protein
MKCSLFDKPECLSQWGFPLAFFLAAIALAVVWLGDVATLLGFNLWIDLISLSLREIERG